ncbi:hypothetical protein [Janthinobacterium agaricidamnosum]|uniref:Uncharacterized protein n=1 Tax=Janthinobacterium agaricidamnosum NBRC 102515 = DSM 9628 TaxID=1349767 RepID=W0V4G9_9BURK|nr:hypothetical protein [Janthinobacterium agaricidamnosum]CDG82167.1 hypothetical protein GJA_1516 [Janthinobacterium agaricidamnosum NBRC 102515 = DSM 9628]
MASFSYNFSADDVKRINNTLIAENSKKIDAAAPPGKPKVWVDITPPKFTAKDIQMAFATARKKMIDGE